MSRHGSAAPPPAAAPAPVVTQQAATHSFLPYGGQFFTGQFAAPASYISGAVAQPTTSYVAPQTQYVAQYAQVFPQQVPTTPNVYYQQTVQVPVPPQDHVETKEVKLTRPKVTYESKFVQVPKTIQEPKVVKEKAVRMVEKQIWETKMVAIQVPKTIMVDSVIEVDKVIQVPQVNYVEREIRIPEAVYETKTIKVPKQRTVTEYEEHTIEVEATEEYVETVQVRVPQATAYTYQTQAYQTTQTVQAPTVQVQSGSFAQPTVLSGYAPQTAVLNAAYLPQNFVQQQPAKR